MRTHQRTLLILEVVTVVTTLLSIRAVAQSGSDIQLHYKVYYQCGGERVQVDHCRHDDDGPGYQPTPPQKDYCLVYYPDRPKNGGFMVQTTELRSDIINKLRACGTLNNPQPQHAEPSAAPKASAPSQPSIDTSAQQHLAAASAATQQSLQLNGTYHCNNGMTLTVTHCAQQSG